MDWSSVFPLLLLWAGLGTTWLALGGSALFPRRLGRSGGPSWFARNQSWVTSLLGTMVAALAGYSAWIAGQSQIKASDETTRRQIEVVEDATRRQILATVETTKLQVEAALATTREQIDEARRERRLEYLRQHLAQIGVAIDWLDRVRGANWRIDWFPSDQAAVKSRQLAECNDYIASLEAMPPMPFAVKGRPSARRNAIENASKRYQQLLEYGGPTDEKQLRERVGDIRKTIDEASDLTDLEQVASRREFEVRHEVEALEGETAPQFADRPAR